MPKLLADITHIMSAVIKCGGVCVTEFMNPKTSDLGITRSSFKEFPNPIRIDKLIFGCNKAKYRLDNTHITDLILPELFQLGNDFFIDINISV